MFEHCSYVWPCEVADFLRKNPTSAMEKVGAVVIAVEANAKAVASDALFLAFIGFSFVVWPKNTATIIIDELREKYKGG